MGILPMRVDPSLSRKSNWISPLPLAITTSMRALFLVHNLPDRGSYFRALEIARRFALRGHYVQFAFTSNEKKYRPTYTPMPAAEAIARPEPHPDSLRQMPKPGSLSSEQNFVWAEMPYFTLFSDRQEGWSMPDNYFRMRDAAAGKWDLVFGFSHKPSCVLPALAAQKFGAKMVLDWSDWWGGHEGLFQQCVILSNTFQSMPGPLRWARRATFGIEALTEGRGYRAADAVTLISGEFLRHPRAPRNLADKAYVMHSGAPLDRIRPLDNAAAREAVGWPAPPDAVVLGYIANYHMDEPLLMEAFARVCDSRSDVHLLVVGADFEITNPSLHARTAGRIHHFGRKPFERIGDFLGASDILLLPLRDVALDRARYPHKISDYVAAGRPIIACDIGETGRVFRKFDFGNLCGPSAEGMADEILNVAGAPEQWDALGTRSRTAAEQHFNWDTMCEGLFAWLSEKLRITL